MNLLVLDVLDFPGCPIAPHESGSLRLRKKRLFAVLFHRSSRLPCALHARVRKARQLPISVRDVRSAPHATHLQVPVHENLPGAQALQHQRHQAHEHFR